MSRYQHRAIRPLRLVSACLRGLGRVLDQWPLLLVIAAIVSPITPHLRIQYTYELRGPYRYMLDCDYLGARGIVRVVSSGECPVVTMMDTGAGK